MPSHNGNTPKRDAAAVRRLYARRQMLQNQLREVDDRIVRIGNRLSHAKGFIVPLRGKALLDLAESA